MFAQAAVRKKKEFQDSFHFCPLSPPAFALQEMPDYITETEAQVEQPKETKEEVQQTEKSESTTDASPNTKSDVADKSPDKSKKGMTKKKKTGLILMATGVALSGVFLPDTLTFLDIQNGNTTLEDANLLIVKSLATEESIGKAGLIVNAGFGLGGALITGGAYLYLRADK